MNAYTDRPSNFGLWRAIIMPEKNPWKILLRRLSSSTVQDVFEEGITLALAAVATYYQRRPPDITEMTLAKYLSRMLSQSMFTCIEYRHGRGPDEVAAEYVVSLTENNLLVAESPKKLKSSNSNFALPEVVTVQLSDFTPQFLQLPNLQYREPVCLLTDTRINSSAIFALPSSWNLGSDISGRLGYVNDWQIADTFREPAFEIKPFVSTSEANRSIWSVNWSASNQPNPSSPNLGSQGTFYSTPNDISSDSNYASLDFGKPSFESWPPADYSLHVGNSDFVPLDWGSTASQSNESQATFVDYNNVYWGEPAHLYQPQSDITNFGPIVDGSSFGEPVQTGFGMGTNPNFVFRDSGIVQWSPTPNMTSTASGYSSRMPARNGATVAAVVVALLSVSFVVFLFSSYARDSMLATPITVVLSEPQRQGSAYFNDFDDLGGWVQGVGLIGPKCGYTKDTPILQSESIIYGTNPGWNYSRAAYVRLPQPIHVSDMITVETRARYNQNGSMFIGLTEDNTYTCDAANFLRNKGWTLMFGGEVQDKVELYVNSTGSAWPEFDEYRYDKSHDDRFHVWTLIRDTDGYWTVIEDGKVRLKATKPDSTNDYRYLTVQGQFIGGTVAEIDYIAVDVSTN